MKEHKVNAPLSWREWENRLCLLRFKTFREVTTTLFLMALSYHYRWHLGGTFCKKCHLDATINPQLFW